MARDPAHRLLPHEGPTAQAFISPEASTNKTSAEGLATQDSTPLEEHPSGLHPTMKLRPSGLH